jgi:hypothetical protein
MYGCAFYILHLDNHFPPKYSFESYVGVAESGRRETSNVMCPVFVGR